MNNTRLIALALCASTSLLVESGRALACGCFTPPDPSVPVLQAGERIVFAVYEGQVTAQIQIQYSGDAKDFGWLLPLPSVPVKSDGTTGLELGSDDVFTALDSATAPQYTLQRIYPTNSCQPWWSRMFGGRGNSTVADAGAASDMGIAGDPSGPLVLQSSAGPYDYAVLKADNKDDMLNWLQANHYFVPAGTDDVVGAYLHPGAYFLALKLQPGKSAGDIQPVVLRYASDLPMIPIVLTSATAQPDMNIWVWVLGDSRAIPRNYYHVVLDDAALWQAGEQFAGVGDSHYADVVHRAMKEAPRHQAFITELATRADSVASRVFPPGQFGDTNQLRQMTDAGQYLDYLKENGYAFSSALIAILQKYIAQPSQLQGFNGQPVDAANYYWNFDYWRQTRAWAFQGVDLSFDAGALTDEIVAKIVTPVREAAALFRSYPYLTRLYGTLSPEDMTRDPAFAFNPFLPDVSGSHQATMRYQCSGSVAGDYDGVLSTEQGFALAFPAGSAGPRVALPGALRVEILRESGEAEVVTDNSAAIAQTLGGAEPAMGCSVPREHGATGGAIAGALLALSIAMGVRRRSARG